MSEPIYDSRDILCKKPFGAVKTGQEVSFTIYIPKIQAYGEPVLKIMEMDHWDNIISVPMAYSGSNLLTNAYSCTFTQSSPALLSYYFEILYGVAVVCVKRGADGSSCLNEHAGLWQLTVYDKDMNAPDFFGDGVLYQIFPDRFCSSGEPNNNVPYDRVMRADWGGIPYWRPNEHGEVTNSDYFGGDLAGIESKLGYLSSLGVTTVYFNPVFEAHSNHRYNTADYMKIDPSLGTNEDFRRLCEKAKEHGISVILDGVFSHTGSDSVYFNKNGRYGGGGAYNDPESPYRRWYTFSDYPNKYESWWGFPTLPNVNETNADYLEFICGENGVLRYWMGMGAAGFRLDVADELPDGFLDALRESVKGFDENSLIIGEVWEDASNKVSYSQCRRYLLGAQLDSVMNYPFMNALLQYIGTGNHDVFYNTIISVLENYPQPSIRCLMNSLSTHDTVRAITVLSGPVETGHGRDWQEAHNYLPADRYAHGCRMFALASILQFGLPGVPCVYYGDEAGVCGYSDPFNRTCYPWGHENTQLLELIRSLGNMRREYRIFADADFMPLLFSPELCCFTRESGNTRIVFAVNRGESVRQLGAFLPADGGEGKVLVVYGEYINQSLAPCSGVVLYFPVISSLGE